MLNSPWECLKIDDNCVSRPKIVAIHDTTATFKTLFTIPEPLLIA